MGNELNKSVLELQKVGMAYSKPTGEPLTVLTGIDMSLRDGEFLGLLGRSGSGKSTMLRIAAGLIKPTEGCALYRGVPLTGPSEGISVVFQTFALYPWLTVLENVELGLDALDMASEESRSRALSAIDLIGLDGFQSAYPRELSGGMRQRVGFARAIVGDPTMLLMDEPFSALDVLTAETLRTDFIDLWTQRQIATKAVLLVTHNIEEAVLMCDRVLVLSSHPGRIAAEIEIPLRFPRNRFDSSFHAIVDEIYSILTSRTTESILAQSQIRGGLVQVLPTASISRLTGIIETLVSPTYGGQAELARLASSLNLEIDDLFPIAEGLHILEFAEIKSGAIKVTAAGRVFSKSDTDDRKKLFKEHLLRFVPLAAHIRNILDQREGHHARRIRFESELEDHLTEQDVETTLQAVIGWGRYAELFAYDDQTQTFSTNLPG